MSKMHCFKDKTISIFWFFFSHPVLLEILYNIVNNKKPELYLTISKSCQQLLTCFVKEDDSKIFLLASKFVIVRKEPSKSVMLKKIQEWLQMQDGFIMWIGYNYLQVSWITFIEFVKVRKVDKKLREIEFHHLSTSWYSV